MVSCTSGTQSIFPSEVQSIPPSHQTRSVEGMSRADNIATVITHHSLNNQTYTSFKNALALVLNLNVTE